MSARVPPFPKLADGIVGVNSQRASFRRRQRADPVIRVPGGDAVHGNLQQVRQASVDCNAQNHDSFRFVGWFRHISIRRGQKSSP